MLRPRVWPLPADIALKSVIQQASEYCPTPGEVLNEGFVVLFDALPVAETIRIKVHTHFWHVANEWRRKGGLTVRSVMPTLRDRRFANVSAIETCLAKRSSTCDDPLVQQFHAVVALAQGSLDKALLAWADMLAETASVPCGELLKAKLADVTAGRPEFSGETRKRLTSSVLKLRSDEELGFKEQLDPHLAARFLSLLRSAFGAIVAPEAAGQDLVMIARLRSCYGGELETLSCTIESAVRAESEENKDLAEISYASKIWQAPPELLTLKDLAEEWKCCAERTSVIQFKGQSERKAMTDLRCFSNFYSETDFEFELPNEFCADGFELSETERRVRCGFSEKAIMLCKAALMGDRASWDAICAATDPAATKRLGRQVRPWNDSLWKDELCSVAFQVVYQKFSQIPTIQRTLLATGKSLIVEATAGDKVWGIGMDKHDEDIPVPARWRGTNVLGWALVRARERLK